MPRWVFISIMAVVGACYSALVEALISCGVINFFLAFAGSPDRLSFGICFGVWFIIGFIGSCIRLCKIVD